MTTNVLTCPQLLKEKVVLENQGNGQLELHQQYHPTIKNNFQFVKCYINKQRAGTQQNDHLHTLKLYVRHRYVH